MFETPSLAPPSRRQAGQAAVFVLLFLGILLSELNFLYKQGRITSDKMEMQNAADAAAYSIAVTEARDLNFAAYMNRAMVANEVAIGQLMGLASWAFHFRSFGDFLELYAKGFDVIPIIGNAIAGALRGVSGVFRALGTAFVRLMTPLARFGAAFLHLANKFYSLAQWGYHITTGLFAWGSISEMLAQNAPDGTRVSEFGIASLIGHFASYGGGVIDLPVPGGTFTTAYNPATRTAQADYDNGDKGEVEGFERFAALVRDSGDPFIAQRGWKFGLHSPRLTAC